MKRSKSEKYRQYNGQKKKRTKGKKMIYKILHRKQKIELPLSPFAIDNVPSLNNSMFADFVDLIYPIELEIKVTINTTRSNS
jgi:hypothetical protein